MERCCASDFISAEAGITRRAQTIPGHRYQIEAWGKHVRSQSPVELSLGVDLTGGEAWQAGTVTWHPWDETEEEVWVQTQVVVQATGPGIVLRNGLCRQRAGERSGMTVAGDAAPSR